ncbi:hypothetical protein BS47DRAFT_1336428 [Hydnum rufescens UP504]|uniref:Uncharacterized protein n=1 Tax=Hydnum rufescens UP504 TaxID=1448309 RepID=A0A9P6B9Q4_9AGAM|nr:hypothetical protein BS47DRAFT_1336428 [Hydnum rufescens UP504]
MASETPLARLCSDSTGEITGVESFPRLETNEVQPGDVDNLDVPPGDLALTLSGTEDTTLVHHSLFDLF